MGFTISEVAVDWQEPVVLRRYAAYPLPALTDIGLEAAASKHTTVPINHTRPSPSSAFVRCHHFNRNSGHPITAYYSFIDPERMKG